MVAPRPGNEFERMAVLRSYEVLDTQYETAFDGLVKLAARLTRTPIALVTLIDSDRQWFKARVGLDVAETPRDIAFCAHAINTPGEPLVVPDALNDPRFANNPFVTGEPGIRFYAGVPLVSARGFALGTLCVIDRKPRELTSEERDNLISLAETVMATLDLRRSMREVRELVLTDALTNLANRPAFFNAVEGAIARRRRHGDPFALLYLDLDGFKQVNDRLGHAAGDEVLRRVAAILRTYLRREDVAARLSGDEFAALLVGGDVAAFPPAERIRAEIERELSKTGFSVTASIGAVTFDVPPCTAADALAAADAMMYSAKAAGRNRVAHRDFPGATPEGGSLSVDTAQALA